MLAQYSLRCRERSFLHALLQVALLYLLVLNSATRLDKLVGTCGNPDPFSFPPPPPFFLGVGACRIH